MRLMDNYIISGGADSAIVAQDMRKLGEALHRDDSHSKFGVHSLSFPDSQTLLVGDGAGFLYSYEVSSFTLRYGLGASQSGSVAVIESLPTCNRVVTGAQDGKALAFRYR